MTGSFKCQLGEVKYIINDQRIVILKGKGKCDGKPYFFSFRINPDGTSQWIIQPDLSHVDTTDIHQLLCISWDKFLLKHPMTRRKIQEDAKKKITQRKYDDIRSAVEKLSVQIANLQNLLKEE